MTRRLLVSCLTITVFVLAVFVVPLGLTFASRERDQLGVADRYSERTGARIVDAEGLSVADSDPPTESPRDFSTRPEFRDALDGARADGERYSETLAAGLIYVAVPVASGGTVHGAVRVTYTTAELDERVRENWVRLGALSVFVLVTVAGVGVLLARGVTRPVRRFNAATESLAAGDLGARVSESSGPPEIRALGHSWSPSRRDDLRARSRCMSSTLGRDSRPATEPAPLIASGADPMPSRAGPVSASRSCVSSWSSAVGRRSCVRPRQAGSMSP
jgi:HAMP domain-containing protein